MNKNSSITVKRLAYLLIFVTLEQISLAQQLPLYSQYLYNKFLINPALAGNDGYTSFILQQENSG